MDDEMQLRFEALKLAVSHMKVEGQALLPAMVAEQGWRWERYISTGEWPTVEQCREYDRQQNRRG